MLYLANLDLNKNQLLNAALQKLALAPVDPVTGQIYFNTETGRAFLWTGTAWLGMDSIGATMTAENIVASINGSTYIIDDDNLSPTIRDVIAASHTSHTIANVTGLQSALDGKVDDGQVLTDVPANAKFTDTVTSINGKTGIIVKADIVALGIPAQDTVYTHPTTDGNKHVPVTGTTNNGKVLKAGSTAGTFAWATDDDTITTINGKTGAIVKADIVALGIPGQDTTYGVFTTALDGLVPKTTTSNTTDFLRRDGTWAAPPDTKYSLPIAGASLGGVKAGGDITIDVTGVITVNDDSHGHIVSNIDGLQTALDSKVDDGQVLTDVPANAKFTDTITTINGKTGVIGKADITALGIPAQDTTYANATTAVAGLMSNTDKTKLDGVATNANNYSHPTGDGNLHVPLTGTGNNGKVLKAGPTAGSLIWADDIDTKYTAGTGLTLTGTVFTPTFGTTVGTIAQGNDARFTDARTPKSHSHPISDVTSLQTALDGKVDDGQVLTDVPAGAIFTDTVTSINGKTGVIAKADITALGIPAQDTTYGLFSTSANGLVPKTTTSNTTDYLRRDGSWAAPPDTKYTLPTASASVLGGIKSGTDITIDASGNVSVNDDSHNHTIANVDGLQTALDAKETPSGATAKASVAENNAKSYADTKISALVDSSPAALDTLNELATALGNDPNFATSMTTMISQKTNKYTTTVASATAVVITHNLNTRDVIVQLRDTASPYAIVMTDVEITSVNTITLKFAVAPAASAYTVTVIG